MMRIEHRGTNAFFCKQFSLLHSFYSLFLLLISFFAVLFFAAHFFFLLLCAFHVSLPPAQEHCNVSYCYVKYVEMDFFNVYNSECFIPSCKILFFFSFACNIFISKLFNHTATNQGLFSLRFY